MYINDFNNLLYVLVNQSQRVTKNESKCKWKELLSGGHTPAFDIVKMGHIWVQSSQNAVVPGFYAVRQMNLIFFYKSLKTKYIINYLILNLYPSLNQGLAGLVSLHGRALGKGL